MRCEEMRDHIVDFYDKTLEQKVEEEINEHLLVCSACSKDYEAFTETAEQLVIENRSKKRGISAFDDFDQLMLDALESQQRNRFARVQTEFKRLAIIAAIIIIAVTLTSLTPAAAAIKSAIMNFTSYIFEDKGIENSLEKGYGQIIEKSDTKDDLTFTIHSAVSDENRTVLLVGANYNGVLNEKADNMTFYGMEITDKEGANITGGYSTRFDFDELKLELSGNIDLGRLKKNKKNLNIKISTIVFSKQQYEPININLEAASFKEMKRVININNEIIKSVVLQNVILTGNSLKIEYDVNYTDKIFAHGGNHIKLLNKDGTEEYPYESGMSFDTDYKENTAKMIASYDVNGLNLSEYRLELTYPKPISVISGDWKIKFNINSEAAKKATVTLKPNRSFEIGGYTLKITKVVFTPSMTSIKIESKEINPLAILGQMSLKTKKGETIKTSYGSTDTVVEQNIPYENYSSEYQFEPVYDEKDLSLQINSAKVPEKVDFELTLKPEEAGIQKKFKAGDSEYYVSFAMKSKNIIEVIIKDSDMNARNDIVNANLDIYVENEDGTKIYNEFRSHSVRDTDQGLYFNFANPGNEKCILHIESIAKYEDTNIVVPIN